MLFDPANSAEPCSLGQLLRERGPLPPDAALAVFRQLLDQLRVLHAAGRTHRAVNPETVSLNPSGAVTLSDPEPVQELSALCGDEEACPPELHHVPFIRLPADIQEARQVLSGMRVTLDPRRVDV